MIENWMLGNQILVYNTMGEGSCYFHEKLVILNKICFHENCSKLDSWRNYISLVENSNVVEIILVEESIQWRIVQMPNFWNLRSWFHMDCVAECGVDHEKKLATVTCLWIHLGKTWIQNENWNTSEVLLTVRLICYLNPESRILNTFHCTWLPFMECQWTLLKVYSMEQNRDFVCSELRCPYCPLRVSILTEEQ